MFILTRFLNQNLSISTTCSELFLKHFQAPAQIWSLGPQCWRKCSTHMADVGAGGKIKPVCIDKSIPKPVLLRNGTTKSLPDNALYHTSEPGLHPGCGLL